MKIGQSKKEKIISFKSLILTLSVGLTFILLSTFVSANRYSPSDLTSSPVVQTYTDITGLWPGAKDWLNSTGIILEQAFITQEGGFGYIGQNYDTFAGSYYDVSGYNPNPTFLWTPVPSQTPCSISATVTTPSNVYVGDMVYTTVKLTNSGDVGGNSNVIVSLCRDGSSYCEGMTCNAGSYPNIYVSGKSTNTLNCWKTATGAGYNYIKVDYSGCNADPTIFSGKFMVFSPTIQSPAPSPTCQININRINLERDGVDPDTFYLGDNIRVSTDVSVTGADPLVTLYFFVDNSLFETKSVNIPVGSSTRVTFDKLIYTSNYGVRNPTVKIIGTSTSCTSSELSKVFSIITRPSPPVYYSPPTPTCQISLVDKIVPSSLQVGNNLNIWVKLRMTFVAVDPTASVTVYVERETDPSQTKTFNFPYSGSMDEETFTFFTSGWTGGRYNVYVSAIGENNCGVLSKTFIGSLTLNPITPSPSCTEQFLNNFQCSGNYKQQLYRYSNCNTQWINVENCNYGCSAGSCIVNPPAPNPTCTPQYIINNYRCSGNNRQQLYQYSDCRTEWRSIENCNYGCSNGYCSSAPTPPPAPTPQPCTAKYLNSYRCIDKTRQQLYQNSDCRTEWRDSETCQYGCSSDGCFESQSASTVSTGTVVYATDIRSTVGETRVARDVTPKVEEKVEMVQAWSQTNVSSSPAGLIFVLIFLVIAVAIGVLATKLKFGPIKLGTPSFGKTRTGGRNEAECFHGEGNFKCGEIKTSGRRNQAESFHGDC